MYGDKDVEWTTGNVDTLRTKWAAGWSAAQIVPLIPNATRSGVLGKVARLKLPPRDKGHPGHGSIRIPSARTRVTPSPLPRPDNKPLNRSFADVPPPATSAGRIRNVTRLQAKANGHDPGMPQRRNPSHNILAKLAIDADEPGVPEKYQGDPPDGTGIKLSALSPNTCRFPRGDPRDEDFEFCGDTAVTGRPYCAHHCRIAYEPPRTRARQDNWAFLGAPRQS